MRDAREATHDAGHRAAGEEQHCSQSAPSSRGADRGSPDEIADVQTAAEEIAPDFMAPWILSEHAIVLEGIVEGHREALRDQCVGPVQCRFCHPAQRRETLSRQNQLLSVLA